MSMVSGIIHTTSCNSVGLLLWFCRLGIGTGTRQKFITVKKCSSKFQNVSLQSELQQSMPRQIVAGVNFIKT